MKALLVLALLFAPAAEAGPINWLKDIQARPHWPAPDETAVITGGGDADYFEMERLASEADAVVQNGRTVSGGTVGHERDVISFTVEPPSEKHHGGVYRLMYGIANEVKQTFIDVKHDPIWAAYVIGTITLNALDTSTTCVGRTQGRVETNPLLPRYPSCGQLVAIAAPLTIVHLTAMHKFSGMFADSCRREAANPDSRWWKTSAGTHNPETCKYAVPIAGMAAVWPVHARIIKSNFDYITWRKPEKEK